MEFVADEFEYGNFPGDQVEVINVIMVTNCSVADPFSQELYWQKPTAFLVRATGRAGVAPTGANITFNAEVNDTDAYSSEVTITLGSTAEFDSGITADNTAYDIGFGEKYHISTSLCGSTIPGGSPLTFTLSFVLP